MKNQVYDLKYKSSAVHSTCNASLGTIEMDASGFLGKFKEEKFRGVEIINKLLELKFSTVLDVGAGLCKQAKYLKENEKLVYTCDYGSGHNSIDTMNYDYVGDFNILDIQRKFDVVLCSHILEHQLNTHQFLKKVVSLTEEGGYITIIVPPRKPFLIGGHVSLWNAGLVLYHLILAGVDCSKECYIKQYDYNIGIIVKKSSFNIDSLGITYDGGDIDNFLYKYFPFDAYDGFNGDIMELNWNVNPTEAQSIDS